MKPIIFRTKLVQAIQKGVKTQTRRVIKPQPTIDDEGRWNWQANKTHSFHLYHMNTPTGDPDVPPGLIRAMNCHPECFPYHVGDILYVKETYNIYDAVYGENELGYPVEKIPKERGNYGVLYKADGHDGPWRPSIYMPKWAARLFLKVTNVRVERIQDITNPDAMKEGIDWSPSPPGLRGPGMPPGGVMHPPPVVVFRELWDGINGKRGFGWSENPWVFAIDFERCDADD